MSESDLLSAAEHIVNGKTFYVEARVGSNNHRNYDRNGPCRAVWDGGSSNEAADHVIRVFASAYLAECAVDDETEIDWPWLASVAEMHRDEGYWDVPPSGDVWWEIGAITFSCEPRDMDEDDREMVAMEWQIDGETLPDMLVPETRGHLRALCRRLGAKLKGPK